MKIVRILPLIISALGFPGGSAFGVTDYPTKPIKIVVPSQPSGGMDFVGRVVADQLAKSFKSSVVVENRPGSGSVVGSEAVAKSAPDGYTLLVIHNGIAINPFLYKGLSYDAIGGFAQVAIVGTTANALVANAKLPVKNVRELLAYIRARPGALNYASGGAGGTTHLAMEYFMMVTGTKIVHVPFKGGSLMLSSMVRGDTQVTIASLGSATPFLKSGKILALATTGTKRSIFLPDVPTLKESGIPEYEFSVFYGLHTRATTPKEIITKLNAAVSQFLADPSAKQQLAKGGIEVSDPMSPAEFTKFVRAETEKMRRVVKASGAQVE